MGLTALIVSLAIIIFLLIKGKQKKIKTRKQRSEPSPIIDQGKDSAVVIQTEMKPDVTHEDDIETKTSTQISTQFGIL